MTSPLWYSILLSVFTLLLPFWFVLAFWAKAGSPDRATVNASPRILEPILLLFISSLLSYSNQCCAASIQPQLSHLSIAERAVGAISFARCVAGSASWIP